MRGEKMAAKKKARTSGKAKKPAKKMMMGKVCHHEKGCEFC